MKLCCHQMLNGLERLIAQMLIFAGEYLIVAAHLYAACLLQAGMQSLIQSEIA